MSKSSYVYQITVDGTPRYIGKGTGGRKDDHLRKARSINRARADGLKVKAARFHNKLAKAVAAGARVEALILVAGLSSDEAFAREALEIAAAPAGQLWNIADGGAGFSSEKVAEQWSSSEGRASKLAALNRPEVSAKKSAANRRRWADEDARKRHGEIVRSLAADPEWKAEWAEASRERWSSPESRSARSDLSRTQWAEPEYRDAHVEARKRVWADPEKRAKIVAAQRAASANPEVRENRRRAAQIRWAKARAAT